MRRPRRWSPAAAAGGVISLLPALLAAVVVGLPLVGQAIALRGSPTPVAPGAPAADRAAVSDQRLREPSQPAREPLPTRLVSSDNFLLEYSLGEERSLLRTVTDGGHQTFDLPPEAEIEDLVQLAYAFLLSGDRFGETKAEIVLSRLSDILLGPVASDLSGRRRLSIVPDGVLWQLPFAALPLPSGSPAPSPATPPGRQPLLVDSHEITLVAAFGDHAARVPPTEPQRDPLTLAIFADPVVSSDDERLMPVHPDASLRRRSQPSGGGRGGDLPAALARLPFTSLEAESIRALAGEKETLVATGFGATRDRVLSGELQGYRILHFATHGILDPAGSGGAGLMFSSFDASGRSIQGALWAREIGRLSLPADLVVLSGCRTALGRRSRRETQTDLSRAFFQAGARRLVVSLWQVSDQATAELMGRFYRLLLRDGLTPAAALQQAQRSMKDERIWRSPFFWAGFVVQDRAFRP